MTSAAAWWISLALPAVTALAAWRAGSLGPGGAAAAVAIGVMALRVQWAWGAFLLGWFVLASALSRLGRAEKARRTAGFVEKGDQRDVWQVLANGGVFALCALWWLADGRADGAIQSTLAAAAAGALAAAGADTWSTEIGTLFGSAPVSIRTGRRAVVGTSGAVTWQGSLGGVAGAVLLAALAGAVQMIPLSLGWAVVVGAIAGSTMDTIIGAWWQERRWCAACGAATERAVHRCGAPTDHRGGLRGLTNDGVNALCTVVGALVAAAVAAAGIVPA